MLYAFGFERVGVVVGDLYFLNPRPLAGQEGAERGVRLELRVLERAPLPGSIYSAQPIVVDRPLWRVDLLESVDSPPGSLDRAHHHPRFAGWDPGSRQFSPELSAAPVDWLGAELSDLDAVLERAGAPAGTAGPADAEGLRQAVPDILDVVRRLLARVASGELATPDGDGGDGVGDGIADSARTGWL